MKIGPCVSKFSCSQWLRCWVTCPRSLYKVLSPLPKNRALQQRTPGASSETSRTCGRRFRHQQPKKSKEGLSQEPTVASSKTHAWQIQRGTKALCDSCSNTRVFGRSPALLPRVLRRCAWRKGSRQVLSTLQSSGGSQYTEILKTPTCPQLRGRASFEIILVLKCGSQPLEILHSMWARCRRSMVSTDDMTADLTSMQGLYKENLASKAH